MKNILTKILEGNINKTPEFTKTFALIEALKDWYSYGVENARKDKSSVGMMSPYIKSFTKGTEDFIRKTLMDGLEYMSDTTINEIINACSLDVKDEDGFDKIEEELVKYIFKK